MLIETAILTAALSYNSGKMQYTFDTSSIPQGNTLVAFVQVHSSASPFAANPSWTYIGQVNSYSGGPKIAAYTKVHQLNGQPMQEVFFSGAIPTFDNYSEAVIVALSNNSNMKLASFGSMDGADTWHDFEYFKSPVQIAVGSVKAGDTLVWIAMDNKVTLNSTSPAGTVGAPIGQSMPVEQVSADSSNFVLNFTLERGISAGPNSEHPVNYAGFWVKFSDKKKPVFTQPTIPPAPDTIPIPMPKR